MKSPLQKVCFIFLHICEWNHLCSALSLALGENLRLALSLFCSALSLALGETTKRSGEACHLRLAFKECVANGTIYVAPYRLRSERPRSVAEKPAISDWLLKSVYRVPKLANRRLALRYGVFGVDL